MTAADRLAELAALADAATEGPWETEGPWSLGHTVVGPRGYLIDAVDGGVPCMTEPDAAFVAASREAVPALIAALRAVLAHAEHHIAIADGHDHHRPCEAKARRALARVLIAEINAALGVTS